MKKREFDKEDLEYYEKLVDNDKALKDLSKALKYRIAYWDWTAYCGYSDDSKPVSKLVKRIRSDVLEKANEVVTKVLLKEKVSHGIITKVNVKLAMLSMKDIEEKELSKK